MPHTVYKPNQTIKPEHIDNDNLIVGVCTKCDYCGFVTQFTTNKVYAGKKNKRVFGLGTVPSGQSHYGTGPLCENGCGGDFFDIVDQRVF